MNRSQVGTALAPDRQIGVQLDGEFTGGTVRYLAGLFNGNGVSANGNDGGRFMYVGRVIVRPFGTASQPSSGLLDLGVDAAWSEDNETAIVGGLLPAFSGNRLLLGGDVLYVSGPLHCSGELIYSRLRSAAGSLYRPYGFHATVGYRVADRSQLLLRLDSFFADGLQDDSHLVVIGYNLWPTQATELQVNYVIPTESRGFRHHQLLVNAQLGF